jgi:hypothetical protein
MRLRLLTVVVAALPLAACSLVIGGATDTCGERPAGGGPPVIVTKDQELCDIVQIRVAQAVEDDPGIGYARLLEIRDKSMDWQGQKTLDGLVAAIRRDAGDKTADAVQRAVDSVMAQSKRPLRVEGDDVQPCLVKGAAKGARLAVMRAGPWPAATPQGAAAEKQ